MKRFIYRIIRWPVRRWDKLLLQRTSLKLEQLIGPSSPSYQQYLHLQLERTFLKKRAPLQERTRDLVDKLSELENLSECRVLCIGCRNTAELDYFHTKGCYDVIGIDLHSQRADIVVMDMHHMNFPTNHFDVIYSCHSLEHSQEPIQVITEILRVARSNALIAIEVPVNFEPRGADLVDFKSLDALHHAFDEAFQCIEKSENSPGIQVLWSDQYQAAGYERNNCIRTIYRIQK